MRIHVISHVCFAAFLQQLQLWHEMKCSFDARHPGYSKLNMQQLAEQHFAGQQVEPNNLPAPSQNEQVTLHYDSVHTPFVEQRLRAMHMKVR